jgi:hypothetical protein
MEEDLVPSGYNYHFSLDGERFKLALSTKIGVTVLGKWFNLLKSKRLPIKLPDLSLAQDYKIVEPMLLARLGNGLRHTLQTVERQEGNKLNSQYGVTKFRFLSYSIDSATFKRLNSVVAIEFDISGVAYVAR